ncbi:hypothetical protein EVAR_51086_1 [Eumeta japonica]|uniref:Uncharacterized protein n=1 Tax=Eumeta variegata TaxID=151549 RepID=A0A4C1XJJ0_EUMVA|nr:hypothetical protein EVAR_51086_1 [Eumeta japonica]
MARSASTRFNYSRCGYRGELMSRRRAPADCPINGNFHGWSQSRVARCQRNVFEWKPGEAANWQYPNPFGGEVSPGG